MVPEFSGEAHATSPPPGPRRRPEEGIAAALMSGSLTKKALHSVPYALATWALGFLRDPSRRDLR